MSVFLHGKALTEKIKEICAGEDVRCAVAFLGQGVRSKLFPIGIENVQIICDIGMGCTTKWALQEFGAPKSAKAGANSKLRVCDGFHGKVYLSSRGAVIGSPNMSNHGLGRTLAGDWNLETGVFCLPESDACKKARIWFDEAFNTSLPVSWMDVCRAADAVRDAGRPPNNEELRDLSLLERVERFPNRFEGITFLITEEDLPQAKERELLDKEDYDTKDGVEVIVWNQDLERVEATNNAIGYHWLDEGGWQVDGYTKVHASAKNELLMFGVNDWNAVRRSLQQPDIKPRALKRDLPILSRLRSFDQATYTASELAAAIKRSKPS